MDPNRGRLRSAAGVDLATDPTVERLPLPTTAVRATFYASTSLAASRPARRWLATQLDLAGVDLPPHRVEDALLILDELVTNVIAHAASGPTVRYGELDDRIVVEVFDRHWDVPRLLPLDPARPWGFGLWLVDALADAWGWARIDDGRKFVWFELS